MAKSYNNLLLSILGLIVFLFILITYAPLFSVIDNLINSPMIKIQSVFFVQIAKAISYIFEPVIVIIASLLIALIFYFKDYKEFSYLFTIAMILDGGLIYLFKFIVERARPLNSLIIENSSSFPSGHATTAVVFFGLLIYFITKYKPKLKKINILFILSIILICFDRIYLNVHWFSDVLAGIFLGLFILFGTLSFYNLISIKKQ